MVELTHLQPETNACPLAQNLNVNFLVQRRLIQHELKFLVPARITSFPKHLKKPNLCREMDNQAYKLEIANTTLETHTAVLKWNIASTVI